MTTGVWLSWFRHHLLEIERLVKLGGTLTATSTPAAAAFALIQRSDDPADLLCEIRDRPHLVEDEGCHAAAAAASGVANIPKAIELALACQRDAMVALIQGTRLNLVRPVLVLVHPTP